MLKLGVVLTAILLASCAKSPTPPEPEIATKATGEAPLASPSKAAPSESATQVLTDEQAALIFDSPVLDIDGKETTLASYRGTSLLLVNVASECGFTPQYEQLQELQQRYGEKGFTVIGFPSNQFGGQEPGTSEEIVAFGKEHYGVEFPLMQKLQPNGEGRHPIYKGLIQTTDADGKAGDVQWNFEKFLISKDGKSITRFRSKVAPTDPALVKILESGL